MYLQFFGLREKPFALSPDPRYLFLAESHREALAHLLYGVDQGEGFIAVVGEVGTGKTTLCRTLLQRLGSETEVAFIFNPDLTPLELLETVCDEFGVAVPGGASRRDLNDRINEFLVHNKRQGRRVLLIIDEAQNLQADTLEQVRLLSNLETETSKLIQIVLLGQPELETKLASQELRQLRQRISVWWRLGPLKRAETSEYVRHRLRVAGASGREPISDAALREVHRRSLGVPRVVNVLCDRALLAAWTEGRREVGARHVRRAVTELGPGREASAPARLRRWLLHPGWMAAVGVLALVFGAWQLLEARGALPDWLAGLRPPPAVSAPPPAPEPAASLEPARAGARDAAPGPGGGSTGASGPEGENATPPTGGVDADTGFDADPGADRGVAEPLAALLERLGARESEGLAAGALLSSWAVPAQETPVASLAELDRALAGRDLRIQRLDDTDLAMLSALNHPAVLRLEGPDGGGRAVVLRHLDPQTAVLAGLGGGAATEVPTAQLETRWGGEAWIVWRDFVSLPAVIQEGHSGSAVYWLQRTLANLGFYAASPTGRYDDTTRSAVRAFQASRGLPADGRVGPHTKMALYDALGEFAFPRLRAGGAG